LTSGSRLEPRWSPSSFWLRVEQDGNLLASVSALLPACLPVSGACVTSRGTDLERNKAVGFLWTLSFKISTHAGVCSDDFFSSSWCLFLLCGPLAESLALKQSICPGSLIGFRVEHPTVKIIASFPSTPCQIKCLITMQTEIVPVARRAEWYRTDHSVPSHGVTPGVAFGASRASDPRAGAVGRSAREEETSGTTPFTLQHGSKCI